jgi:hypothetical protein
MVVGSIDHNSAYSVKPACRESDAQMYSGAVWKRREGRWKRREGRGIDCRPYDARDQRQLRQPTPRAYRSPDGQRSPIWKEEVNLRQGHTYTPYGKTLKLLTTNPKKAVKGIRRSTTITGHKEGCVGGVLCHLHDSNVDLLAAAALFDYNMSSPFLHRPCTWMLQQPVSSIETIPH